MRTAAHNNPANASGRRRSAAGGINRQLSVKLMPRLDFRTPRIYVEEPLAAGREIPLDSAPANHLVNVLRRKSGEPVLVFNGRDGEWRAELGRSGRRPRIVVREKTRAQPEAGDLHFLFAPLKHMRLDYLVQKAVEMGVSRLRPVITRHTQVTRVNVDRMRANVVEAAQQCGVLALPAVDAPIAFSQTLAEADRLLIFCDEASDLDSSLEALRAASQSRSVAVLIGPEGGFAEDERGALLRRANVVRLSLGPRILRADTAAVAALALVQATLGDWQRGG